MVRTKECNDHSVEELNLLFKNMIFLAAPELDAVYQKSGDLRSKRFATMEEYEIAWAAESGSDLETLKHAKCAEIGMMFAHHLSETSKKSFAETLPTIPIYDEDKASDTHYASSLSCQTGHAMVKGGDGSSSHQWPDWPEELHYKAKGHGAYPFWWGGGSDDGTADLEVWWSEKQGYELFYHSTCTGNGESWLQGQPCYHLMLTPESPNADPLSYLFSEDRSECCLTNPKSSDWTPFGPPLTLAPAQGTFWKTFTDMGTVDFNGIYYQGKAHYYVLRNVPGAVADFWYFTDLEGKPVQQGEAGTGPTDQGYPSSRGHTIWHDYQPGTLDTAAQDSSVAEVPAACLATTTSCAFP